MSEKREEKVSFRLPSKLLARLRQQAVREDRSLSAVIVRRLENKPKPKRRFAL